MIIFFLHRTKPYCYVSMIDAPQNIIFANMLLINFLTTRKGYCEGIMSMLICIFLNSCLDNQKTLTFSNLMPIILSNNGRSDFSIFAFMPRRGMVRTDGRRDLLQLINFTTMCLSKCCLSRQNDFLNEVLK